MTPRDRWLTVLSGGTPDRVPCDYWATPELTQRLLHDLNCSTERALFEKLGIDKCAYLGPVHPAAREHTWHLQSLFSIWHGETRPVSYESGVYEEDAVHPLEAAECAADIHAFDWPDPADFDIGALRREAAEWKGHPVLGATSEPFYLYCRLRGMERALEDLIERPEIAEAMLGCIHEFDCALIGRVLREAGDVVDLIYLAEDLGTQQSLLISPALFRRYLEPRLRRLAELVHAHGKHVFHHDDGAIRPLIPSLIAAGIDILNPIQWRCRNMEPAQVVEFNSGIVFHGGIDNQHTLPYGTPDEVRAEVRRNLALFPRYIVAPCHNLQANTPTANVCALYGEVHAG